MNSSDTYSPTPALLRAAQAMHKRRMELLAAFYRPGQIPPTWDSLPPETVMQFTEEAKAVIESLREPSMDMLGPILTIADPQAYDLLEVKAAWDTTITLLLGA